MNRVSWEISSYDIKIEFFWQTNCFTKPLWVEKMFLCYHSTNLGFFKVFIPLSYFPSNREFFSPNRTETCLVSFLFVKRLLHIFVKAKTKLKKSHIYKNVWVFFLFIFFMRLSCTNQQLESDVWNIKTANKHFSCS